MNGPQQTACLAKDFDTVDHTILCRKLQAMGVLRLQ